MQSEKHVPIIVVCFLGVTSILLSSGVLMLAHEGKAPDAGLYTLAGTAIGALSSLLTQAYRTRGTESDPVNVTTAPDNPLPVQEVTPDAPVNTAPPSATI